MDRAEKSRFYRGPPLLGPVRRVRVLPPSSPFPLIRPVGICVMPRKDRHGVTAQLCVRGMVTGTCRHALELLEWPPTTLSYTAHLVLYNILPTMITHSQSCILCALLHPAFPFSGGRTQDWTKSRR